MLKRLKYAVISLLVVLSGSLAMVPALANADSSFKNDACAAVNSIDGSNSTACNTKSESALSRLLKLVLNVLSVLVGFTAVVMIVIGGFKFVTSNGDSSNIASARNSILYAVIGLVIVAAAQVMVHFVLANSNAAIKNCTSVTCKSTNK